MIKFRVVCNNVEEWELTQGILFSLGYHWYGIYGKHIISFDSVYKNICVRNDGTMMPDTVDTIGNFSFEYFLDYVEENNLILKCQ
jgi:hypothetical protein